MDIMQLVRYPHQEKYPGENVDVYGLHLFL